jgi:hypothetical protein
MFGQAPQGSVVQETAEDKVINDLRAKLLKAEKPVDDLLAGISTLLKKPNQDFSKIQNALITIKDKSLPALELIIRTLCLACAKTTKDTKSINQTAAEAQKLRKESIEAMLAICEIKLGNTITPSPAK